MLGPMHWVTHMQSGCQDRAMRSAEVTSGRCRAQEGRHLSSPPSSALSLYCRLHRDGRYVAREAAMMRPTKDTTHYSHGQHHTGVLHLSPTSSQAAPLAGVKKEDTYSRQGTRVHTLHGGNKFTKANQGLNSPPLPTHAVCVLMLTVILLTILDSTSRKNILRCRPLTMNL